MKIKSSLKVHMLILLSIVLLIFAFSAAFISYKIYLNEAIDQHKHLASGITNLIASEIDPSKVDDYLKHGEEAEGYKELKNKLTILRDSTDNIEYIYVYRILKDGCHVVFDLDTDEVKGKPAGTVEEFDESFAPYIPKLLNGEPIEPIITDDTYGWLLTVYTPVYDSKGVCQCYAAVDISMNQLKDASRNFLIRLAFIFFLIFAIIFIVSFDFLDKHLISPINSIASFAESSAYDNSFTIENNLTKIHDLKIHNNDEIENLYKAFIKMTEDSIRFTKDLQAKSKTISKMQNSLIETLADLVESRDENTGQHIKKTAAYVKIILEEMKSEGIYTEQLSDSFIENVINSAPLHDIGKIAVPDAILNKPGKLTFEEFEIMKTHTSKGGKIIDSIIASVPESHYLNEAKNLATYHHERWDGKGYPVGLAGEDIPLSARIMAVADVFDALVSKRSYKEGLPYDKAFNIIIEESGTHFDSKLVDAFINSKDKVIKVADQFSEASA